MSKNSQLKRRAEISEANSLEDRNVEDNSFKSHSLAPVQRRTLEYLRTFIADHGYGPTLKDIATSIGVRSPSTAHFHLSRLEGKGFIKRGEDGSIELTELEELKTASSPCAVPLVGLIAAGSPIDAIEDRSVTVDIPPQFLDSRGEIYCLQVSGDSMIDAHIMDGDVIIVRRQDTADDGQIVVALLEDGTATLKTLRRHKGGKILLLPQNPAHQPIAVDKVDIQGRFIGLVREVH